MYDHLQALALSDFLSLYHKPGALFAVIDFALNMPLTAAEIIEHPAFEHVIRDLRPTKKGKVSVAKGRGGPFNIAYEVHGFGSNHIVVSTSHSLRR